MNIRLQVSTIDYYNIYYFIQQIIMSEIPSHLRITYTRERIMEIHDAMIKSSILTCKYCNQEKTHDSLQVIPENGCHTSFAKVLFQTKDM